MLREKRVPASGSCSKTFVKNRFSSVQTVCIESVRSNCQDKQHLQLRSCMHPSHASAISSRQCYCCLCFSCQLTTSLSSLQTSLSHSQDGFVLIQKLFTVWGNNPQGPNACMSTLWRCLWLGRSKVSSFSSLVSPILWSNCHCVCAPGLPALQRGQAQHMEIIRGKRANRRTVSVRLRADTNRLLCVVCTSASFWRACPRRTARPMSRL